MKSDNRMDVELAEAAVEANLSKFSTAVNHLEEKISEGKSKVLKTKAIVNKPKEILNQIAHKAHQITDQVSDRAHHVSDSVVVRTEPLVRRGKDYGAQFWRKFEANPMPFILGGATLFGAMVFLLAEARGTEEEEEESLWGF